MSEDTKTRLFAVEFDFTNGHLIERTEMTLLEVSGNPNDPAAKTALAVKVAEFVAKSIATTNYNAAEALVFRVVQR